MESEGSDLDEQPPKKGRSECPMDADDDVSLGLLSGRSASGGNAKGSGERKDGGDNLAELLKSQFSTMKKDMQAMLKTNTEDMKKGDHCPGLGPGCSYCHFCPGDSGSSGVPGTRDTSTSVAGEWSGQCIRWGLHCGIVDSSIVFSEAL